MSNLLDDVQFDNVPPIGVLPLGTGNDMSRTLHWGKGYDGEDILDLLNEYKTAPICNIDRWNVVIRNDKKDNVYIYYCYYYISIIIYHLFYCILIE